MKSFFGKATDWGKTFIINKEFLELSNKKTKNPTKKCGKGFEQMLHKIRYTNGQEVSERMHNIIIHQGNTNENHSEIAKYNH